ncbi:alpha-amylase [Orenia metallireducens]|uniref:Alpha-amylase n=1 Tax=Orenia metallireducens TaxID=1413210 RepID=A0A285H580_9FIRM|nr:alpha-amylase domain-containing protein [Orenia metallireducens]PRX28630.1 alpha-amylase [Orenia metallireducens]SNY30907.1 alpha-amylase [Orenia metallireducens]
MLKMLKSNRLLLLAILLLSLGLLIGCSSGGYDGDEQASFMLINSSPKDGATISADITGITLEFNYELASKEIAILEDGNAISGLTSKTDGKKVTISGFELSKSTSYELNYSVTNNDGTSINGKINFLTMSNLPDISGLANLNETMMQAFYWEMNTGEYASDYPEEANLWNLLADRADDLADIGITSLWLPPANKAWGGVGVDADQDVGYGTHDLWDLGEFDKQGSVRTKYGTKDQLLTAIDAIHTSGMKAYYDIIFNHRMGAYNKDIDVKLSANSPDKAGGTIDAWTNFDLAGRQKYYTQDKWGDLWHDFKWDWRAFDGVDYAEDKGNGLYLFAGKTWGLVPDDPWMREPEYLMGADVDYYNYPNGYDGTPEPNINVVDEMKAWGEWITKEIGFDGFRIDAVKHVDSTFIYEWIDHVQSATNKELFFVGEAWLEDKTALKSYLDLVDGRADIFNKAKNSELKVFDFPLRAKFKNMRDGNGTFDISTLSTAGLVNDSTHGERAVAFIDNHDTSGSNAENYGKRGIDKYSYQAYAYALTRESTVPTIFWKDYYQHGMKSGLDKLIQARKYYAYGTGHEVDNNDNDVYSYVREGLDNVEGTGLVMMISDGTSGDLVTREINSRQSNTAFRDITGNVSGTVVTDEQGYGDFKVIKSEAKGCSVWVPVID